MLVDDRTFDVGRVFYEKLRDLCADSVVTCPHARHRGQRRMLQPAFQTTRITGYAKIMPAHSWRRRPTGSWRDAQRARRTWRSCPSRTETITETIRMRSAAWMTTRTVSTRVTVAGRELEPGTTLVSSPYTIHSRPDLFDQPQQFSPDRWLPENAASLPRGTFVGYGHGARRCIGDEYGMQGTALALATIAVRWPLELARETDSRPLVTGPALRPRSLHLRLHARPTPSDTA
ncbi:cytochrome P450 [Streptomyces lydicus]|uniref:cytochrome P450 n=1 Tax=Streptomyces lydicus TaxID=47763 RepID=UPI0037991A14